MILQMWNVIMKLTNKTNLTITITIITITIIIIFAVVEEEDVNCWGKLMTVISFNLFVTVIIFITVKLNFDYLLFNLGGFILWMYYYYL